MLEMCKYVYVRMGLSGMSFWIKEMEINQVET